MQAQRAFGVSPDRHYRLLHAAAEEKPKIVVLSVVVQEAEGLEAKDANGELVHFLSIYHPRSLNYSYGASTKHSTIYLW